LKQGIHSCTTNNATKPEDGLSSSLNTELPEGVVDSGLGPAEVIHVSANSIHIYLLYPTSWARTFS
jgi:hypothetical protein